MDKHLEVSFTRLESKERNSRENNSCHTLDKKYINTYDKHWQYKQVIQFHIIQGKTASTAQSQSPEALLKGRPTLLWAVKNADQLSGLQVSIHQ